MKIGFQMDQLSALNFKTDSTLPIIYESQKRNNTNYIFHPNDLHFQKNKVLAQSSQIKFTSAKFNGYKLGPRPKHLNPGDPFLCSITLTKDIILKIVF